MRKIMKCLQDLSEDETLTPDRMKVKLLPLLKGNQLLINWFLESMAMPIAPIVDSTAADYETLTCRKATDSCGVDEETDTYEHIPLSEIHPDPIESPCSLRYINGGIYYGNRTFSPAKLSFTVNTAECNAADGGAGGVGGIGGVGCVGAGGDDAPGVKETVVSPPSAKYRCVHVIKHFGDARIRDHSRYVEMQTDGEAEDSDEENLRHLAADANDYRMGTGGVNELTEPVSSVFTKNLCDDMLLKAHGIRLNPTMHSSLGLNNNDMLNMLRPSLDR